MVNEWNDEVADSTVPESINVQKILDDELQEHERLNGVRPPVRQSIRNEFVSPETEIKLSGEKLRAERIGFWIATVVGVAIACLFVLFVIGLFLSALNWIGGLLQ